MGAEKNFRIAITELRLVFSHRHLFSIRELQSAIRK